MVLTTRSKLKVLKNGSTRTVESYFLDGKKIGRRQYRNLSQKLAKQVHDIEGARHLLAKKGRAWPMECWNLSVNPKQVKEAVETANAKGVPTQFKEDGTPIFESRGHYNRYLKAHGFMNRDAGYGDYAGNNV